MVRFADKHELIRLGEFSESVNSSFDIRFLECFANGYSVLKRNLV